MNQYSLVIRIYSCVICKDTFYAFIVKRFKNNSQSAEYDKICVVYCRAKTSSSITADFSSKQLRSTSQTCIDLSTCSYFELFVFSEDSRGEWKPATMDVTAGNFTLFFEVRLDRGEGEVAIDDMLTFPGRRCSEINDSLISINVNEWGSMVYKSYLKKMMKDMYDDDHHGEYDDDEYDDDEYDHDEEDGYGDDDYSKEDGDYYKDDDAYSKEDDDYYKDDDDYYKDGDDHDGYEDDHYGDGYGDMMEHGKGGHGQDNKVHMFVKMMMMMQQHFMEMMQHGMGHKSGHMGHGLEDMMKKMKYMTTGESHKKKRVRVGEMGHGMCHDNHDDRGEYDNEYDDHDDEHDNEYGEYDGHGGDKKMYHMMKDMSKRKKMGGHEEGMLDDLMHHKLMKGVMMEAAEKHMMHEKAEYMMMMKKSLAKKCHLWHTMTGDWYNNTGSVHSEYGYCLP